MAPARRPARATPSAWCSERRRRGVDIPHVGPDFQTNVPGIFIAGELGGMGLIRNAIEQGRQAIEAVRRLDGLGRAELYDVVIVGGGPAGFAATLAAMQHGLRFVTLEQDSFGGTVAHFPRGKLVMTAPATLPLIGKVKFREISKEKLLAFWDGVARKTGLDDPLRRARRRHCADAAPVSRSRPPARSIRPARSCSRSAAAGRRASSTSRARSRPRSSIA